MEDEGIERKPYGRGTKWTASDLELLQKLIDDGLNLEEIVIQMEDETGVKRSQNSIRTITQKRKMKIPVERDFDVIIDYVRDHYLTETASEMSYKITPQMSQDNPLKVKQIVQEHLKTTPNNEMDVTIHSDKNGR